MPFDGFSLAIRTNHRQPTPSVRDWCSVVAVGRNTPAICFGLERGARNGEPVRAKVWGIVRESSKLLDQLARALVIPHPAALLRAELPEDADADDESDLD